MLQGGFAYQSFQDQQDQKAVGRPGIARVIAIARRDYIGSGWDQIIVIISQTRWLFSTLDTSHSRDRPHDQLSETSTTCHEVTDASGQKSHSGSMKSSAILTSTSTDLNKDERKLVFTMMASHFQVSAAHNLATRERMILSDTCHRERKSFHLSHTLI